MTGEAPDASASAQAEAGPHLVQFRDWEIRSAERQLWVDGELVQVGARAFDVLLALVNRNGQLVRKAELLEAAWPGLQVEENNVSVQIAALRKLLGAGAIATVSGIGYRLSAAPLESSPESMPRTPSNRLASTLVDAAQLVGRQGDLASLHQLIAAHRLVSIVGPGGVGKTTLSKALLAQLPTSDPVFWIDASPLRDEAQLLAQLGKTLSVDLGDIEDARTSLLAATAQLNALVVVDNCEHLLFEIAALIGEAGVWAPGLRWLVTSREKLRLSHERVYLLAPLEIPARDASVEEALRYGAVALLHQRLQAWDRHFKVDASTVGAVVDLCRQLDGLPLAIEMAAARVANLGLENVQRQLRQHLFLLTAPRNAPTRHHTLNSTLHWSHDLLSAAEKKLFRRLSAFVGGFSAEMAHQVACDEPGRGLIDSNEVLPLLDNLIDKSLVHAEPARRRFRLLESTRDFAGLRLDEAEETNAFKHRHAQAIAAFFVEGRKAFDALDDAEWAARYAPERDNLSAALTWACDRDDPDMLAVLVAALAQLDLFAHAQAGIMEFPIRLDVLRSAKASLRAAACVELGWAHYAQGSREVGSELTRQSLDDFRSVGDVAGEYRALAQLVRLYRSRPGWNDAAEQARTDLLGINSDSIGLRTRISCTIAASLFPDGRRTVPLLSELESIAERAGLVEIAARCKVYIANHLLEEGRLEEAIDRAEVHLSAGEPRPRLRALTLSNLAHALVRLGRPNEAAEPIRAALRASPQLVTVLVDLLALIVIQEGRPLDAAVLAGYGSQARRARDIQPDPADALVIAQVEERLRDALGQAKTDELMRYGSALSLAGILATAFHLPVDSAKAPA